MSRTSQSIKNIATGIGSQIVTAAIAFITTRLIKFNLGFEYLGLNGVFSNIISFLSLTELGIGTAIVFALYKPLAEKDTHLICALMQFYKKAYRIVAAIIFSIGIMILPFLQSFVKTSLPIYYVRCLFLLFLANSSATYLLSYKRTLIYADQKNYIITLYSLVFSILTRVLQLVFFLLTNSYVLYLCANIFCTVMLNILLSMKANKLYPYLKWKKVEKLSDDIKSTLKRKIVALSFHSVGTFIVMGTDNILISYFCGVSVVGIYSSYIMVISMVETVINSIYGGIDSSVGNFLVEKDTEEKYVLFEKIEFANSVIQIFVSVCFVVLLNPFVSFWLGEDAVVKQHIVYCLVLSKFLGMARWPINAVKSAAGIFEQDKYAPLIESAVNLIMSCFLAHFIGLQGIIIGTIISTVSVPLWIQPVIVFRNVFNKKPSKYFLQIIKNLFYTIIITVIAQFVINRIFVYNQIVTLVVYFIVTILIAIFAIALFFIRDKNFIFFKEFVFRYIFARK